MGVEDLTFGCGTEKQIRNNRRVQITQINSENIPHCESGNSVADYIDDLRRMFPYIECDDIGRPTMDYKDWVDAVIAADVKSCALGLANEITQRIPFMQGDVARHNGCLWVSLIDNNITEPSLGTQKHGKWLNTCSLVDVINCVLPVKDVPVCPDNCDGVEALPTLCERVEELEANELHIDGFSVVNNALVIHRNDGTTFSIPLIDLIPKDIKDAIIGLPSGAVTFVDSIEGTFKIKPDGNPDHTVSYVVDGKTKTFDEYYILCSEKTFKTSDYSYLTEPGRKIVMSFNASIGYYLSPPVDTTTKIGPMQWGTALFVDGVCVKRAGDSYGLNKSGHNSGLADNGSVTITTTGKDLTIKLCNVLSGEDVQSSGQTFEIDMASATVTFSASNE